MNQNDNSINTLGVLFGAAEIASTINADERKIRRLLKDGQIKGAKKVGSQWAITVGALLSNFDANSKATSDQQVIT